MEARQWLEMTMFIATIVSLPIAAWSIYSARREAKASRDLDAALKLSESFRSLWEANWRRSLRDIIETQEKSQTSDVPSEYREQLDSMRNWIDWFGSLIRAGSISENHVLFGSIRPQFVQIISAGRSVIESDIRENGPEYWAGLNVVAKQLRIKWAEGLFPPRRYFWKLSQ